MSNKPNRKLPDARFTFSPPPVSHLSERRDRYGARYGSAGDVSSGARNRGYYWSYSRIYGDKINWNMNNPANPDKDGARGSSSNEDNDTQPTQSDHGELQDGARKTEGPEHKARHYTGSRDGDGMQKRENENGLSRNRHWQEDGVPDSSSTSRKSKSPRFSSPTETKTKKKKLKKVLKTEQPRSSVEQEDDFFEELFESSLEIINDDDLQHEHFSNSEMETSDGDQGDPAFEALYQKNRQLIQNKRDSGRRKSSDDDNTTVDAHRHMHHGNSAESEAGSAAGGSSNDTGILHRHQSTSKRQHNVHFSKEVSVETFPEPDEEVDGTKTLLAHGDGPPNNIPGTSIPLPPPLPPDLVYTSRSGNSGGQNIETSSKDYGKGPLDYIKGKVLNNLGKDTKNTSEVRRKDSLPKSVSPTELLRKKQRTVTDKIIKQTLSQKSVPSGNLEIHNTKNGNTQPLVKQDSVRDKINAMEDLVRDLKLPVEAIHYRQIENSSRNKPILASDKYNIDSGENSRVFDDGRNTDNKDTEQSFKVDLEKLPANQRYFQDWKSPSQRKASTGNPVNYQTLENQQNKDSAREQTETGESSDRSPGLGAFEYTTPSKLFQNVKARDDADKNSPGLGSFSYTTPSKLFQKIEDRENAEKNSQGLGTFSYTTPSELLMRQEDLKESSSKEKPGYWFFKKNSDTKQAESSSAIKADNESSHKLPTNWTSENTKSTKEGISEENLLPNETLQEDVDIIKKRKQKFMERCKRKKRLDHIEHWTEDHQTCAEKIENIRSNSSLRVIGSNLGSTRESETSIHNIRECFDKIATSTNMVEPVTMIHELLSDFLNLMDRKLSSGHAITIDFLRELEFVYDSLVYIARKLLEQVDETVFQDMALDPSCSIEDPEAVRNYAVWLSSMLESSDKFLHGVDLKADIHKTQQKYQMMKRQSQNDQSNLQTVLSDLGVIKDSLTCLRTDDETDFSSITDLRTLESKADVRQSSVDIDTQKQEMSEKPPPKQAEVAPVSHQDTEYKQDGSDLSELIDKRKQSIQERVRRKKSLDQMQHKVKNHSSRVDKMASILKNGSPEASVSMPTSRVVAQEPGTRSDEGNIKNVPEMKASFSEIMDPFIVTYVYLCDFLDLIERKKALYIDITSDDSRELELIYNTLLMIADQLVIQTEDSEIKAASEILLKQGALERMNSTKSISRALQAQRYACWLINKLGSTATLLLRQSSTDMLDAPDYIAHEHVDTGSQVSLDDVIIDLKNIHDSMTSLIYGQESDFSQITEDWFNWEDSQIELSPKWREISEDSLVSGYLADTNSQESVAGQLYPRDSLLLQHYGKLKTDINGVGETGYYCSGNRKETVRIHDTFVPERQQTWNALWSANSEDMRMPQREWSPRDHRKFSSTSSSSTEDRDKISQYSQATSRPSDNGIGFISPTTGDPMFGEVNYPSPSTSLSKELSLSTLGSDWTLIGEQESAASPAYYHERRGDVPAHSSSQGQFIDQSMRSGMMNQVRPRSQSVAPTSARFISTEKHINGKEDIRDKLGYRELDERKHYEPDHQEKSKASYGRRMSLPVKQEAFDTLKPSTQRYRKSRTGSLLPQTTKAVQQINTLSNGDTLYEEESIGNVTDNFEEDRYLPPDMAEKAETSYDRRMSLPVKQVSLSPSTQRYRKSRTGSLLPQTTKAVQQINTLSNGDTLYEEESVENVTDNFEEDRYLPPDMAEKAETSYDRRMSLPVKHDSLSPSTQKYRKSRTGSLLPQTTKAVQQINTLSNGDTLYKEESVENVTDNFEEDRYLPPDMAEKAETSYDRRMSLPVKHDSLSPSTQRYRQSRTGSLLPQTTKAVQKINTLSNFGDTLYEEESVENFTDDSRGKMHMLPDYQEKAEASKDRRMSLPVKHDSLSPSTQRYRKSRTGSLLPQTTKAVQQINTVYPVKIIFEEEDMENLTDDSRKDTFPSKYVPPDMAQVQVRDRLTSTPCRDSTDTFIVHGNASRDRIPSAVKERYIPPDMARVQVRDKLISTPGRDSTDTFIVNGSGSRDRIPCAVKERYIPPDMSRVQVRDRLVSTPGKESTDTFIVHASDSWEKILSAVREVLREVAQDHGELTDETPMPREMILSQVRERINSMKPIASDHAADNILDSVNESPVSSRRMSSPARRSVDMSSDSDRKSSIPAKASIYMASDVDSFRDQYEMESSMTGRPSVDYTTDKVGRPRKPSKDRYSSKVKMPVDAARDISKEEREGRGKAYRPSDGVPGELSLNYDRDISASLPTRYSYYDDIKRQRHAFYEIYGDEPSLSTPAEGTAETEHGGSGRRRSSLTFTDNPVYYESDTYDVEDYGTVDRTEWQSGESPDSLHLSDPTTKSDISYTQESPREIHWSACFSFPEDSGSVHVDMGPSQFTVNKMGVQSVQDEQESKIIGIVEGDSPDRGQRLYGSTQGLDRRGDAAVSKRKSCHPTGRSMTPDSRSFLMEREVTESQNRKLQMEVTTLQTENKLLKEKYNRATARISELETQLHDTQDDLTSLQDTLNKEMSELSARTRSELDRDKVQMEKRLQGLSKENERLKTEVSNLEKQLGVSQQETGIARQNSEKNKTLEAHKAEIASLKEELHTVKALLEQSEQHLRQEESRHSEVSQQLLQLTELKNALQQQADSGGSGVVTDKQLKSLEKRLKVTEERLHQERADRANNLSAVEEKLLSENARLQASEKEFSRQLHREKDRNKNLEQRLKQVREENEKLRLAMPFDDSVLLSNKETYDIPYSSHSNQRAETLKITDDMNYILSQIERQDGIQSGQEQEMIRVLWNKRELAYKQLRDTELQLKELRLEDNNIVDGLKNLRDTYGQAESKLKQMEEQVEDTRSQMDTLDNTYKQQLSQLVQEKHDAFARLKTAEDILEAVRTENTLLRQSLSGTNIATGTRSVSDSSSTEALQVEVASLNSKVTQLTRQNRLLDGELGTVRVQLEARTKALEDVQGQLDQAQRHLAGGGDEDRKQEKIEILTAQLNSLEVDLNSSTERYNHLLAEKINLEVEVANMKTVSEQKPRHRTETIDSKALQELKDSVAEKESRLTSVTLQLEDTENQLQRTRQDLYIEQEHTSELEVEVETLQLTVSQRAQMFEALSGTEREQHAQYQLLKETLDSVTQELSHKHAQIISLDVNLSGQKDRVAELERELQDLRQQQGTSEGETERSEVRTGDRLRVHELEIERASLKQELTKAYNAIAAAEEQFRTLQTESKQLEQEVVKEKTVVLQITAEKGEIEQHLEELAEEHDALIQAKTQAEDDLIKLENKLQEILQKYESQARKQHGNFETEYSVMTPESRKMASELDTLRLLLDGKTKEVDMLQDKLSRQLIEIDFLNRKVELVHNDSISNREDVARMISELTLKMKEAVTTREVNQFLAGERIRLQSEKNHVGKELEQERQNSDKRKREVEDVIRKVEASEVHQMSIKKEDTNKAQQIISLEAELRNANRNLTTTQTENDQLKSRLDHLQEDVKNLTAINATLEKRLEMEQNSLSSEKNTASKWKEDYNKTLHELELLRHEQLVMGNKLAAEQQTVEKLRKEAQTRDEEITSLHEEIRTLQLELDSNKGQLLLTKDTVEKLSQDKGSIAQDYDGLCRSLTDKERQLNEVRDRTEEKIEFMQREHTAEKLRLEQDKTTAERERDSVRQEMDRLNEELRQKEAQLSTFGKTLSDLETATRKKNELEGLLRQLEGAAGDHKLLLEGQRKEVMSLSEQLAKVQDENTRLQVTNQTVQMDLKAEQATSSREIHDLKLTLEELKSQLENERSYLNDGLTQTRTQLQTTQENLSAITESRDSLQAGKRLVDHQLEELQSQLSDHATARRLLEQSLGAMRLEVEELRNEKNMSEARLVETKNQLTKAEKHLKSEQEKFSQLSARHQELTAITQSTEASVKAKDDKADLLHKEITKLRQMLDSQKQSLTAKMKKTQLEFKQQLDLVHEDKNKLSGQVQKLSTDLDLCREQIANKNRENLKLQEQVVSLEDRLRDSQVRLKHAEDNLRLETENQSHLNNSEIGVSCDDLIDVEWYHEQDEELKRLRGFLAKKAEESGEADKSMWHEMNRVIQELSRQMTSHLDAKPTDNKSSDTQTIQRYKKQLAEVQGELSTEKSMHQITKTSLQALDEDCNRLRQQLHKLRRREKSPTGDRKYKNRMEAINAIIARSQSQAQALLASGGYLEDMNYNNSRSRAQLSPHRGFQSPGPRPDSPDNSYASDLSIASLPPMPFSKYTSTNSAEAK